MLPIRQSGKGHYHGVAEDPGGLEPAVMNVLHSNTLKIDHFDKTGRPTTGGARSPFAVMRTVLPHIDNKQVFVGCAPCLLVWGRGSDVVILCHMAQKEHGNVFNL